MQPSIIFHLNHKSGVPAYQQLMNQIKHSLRLNFLKVGDQLPTVREVCSSIPINANTVLKAYRLLEIEGLVETRQGQGTFVVATVANSTLAFIDFQNQVKELINQSLQNGISPEEIEAAFHYCLQTSQSERLA